MSPRAVAPPPRSTAPRTEGGAVTAKAVPKTAPVAAAATVELPPVVHAIGGSIGGALAILLLYPLERVRVELQSRETREALGRCNDGKNPTAFASGESSSPSSSGSFEVVSSLRSLDEVSFDVTSFADKNSMDEKTAGPIVESISVPIKCSESEPRKRNRPQSYGIIMQCLLDLHKKNELYRGASPTVTTLMVSNAVFFYALQANRQILNSVQQNRRNHRSQASESFKSSFTHYLHCILPKSKLGTSLAASSIAGAINVLLTNPLWVASLRIMESDVQTEPDKTPKSRKNLWNVIHEIARNEGSAALWNGTKTSLLLVSNPIIQHFVYEQLRLGLLNNRARRSKAMGNAARSRRMDNQEHRVLNLTLTEAFAIGALAKTIATVITYPLQLAQVLLRLQRKKLKLSPTKSLQDTTSGRCDPPGVDYVGTVDCLYQRFSRGGILALFQGMKAKLLQTVLTAAFTFLTYEQILGQVSSCYHALGWKR